MSVNEECDIEEENDINPFGQYTDYVKIETHMEFSRVLFLIDKKGKHILSELDSKKFERKKRNGSSVFGEDVGKVYTNLVHVLNVRKFSPRLFFALQYYMDELVFKEVKEYDKFFVEDESYELTKLYLDQSSWISNQDIQEFHLDVGPKFDINEAMCLVCFLREYEDLLFSIEEYIRDLEDKRLKRLIVRTIARMRYKLKIVWDIIVNVITSNINCKDGEKN
jgi:hypothetical protein